MRYLMLVIAGFVLSGCDFFGPDERNKDSIAYVDSVKILSVKDLSARINVVCATPDPCWLFSRSTEFRNNKELTYRIFQIRKDQANCPDVVSSFIVPLEIRVAVAGTYTLKFHRTETTTLDTIITF